MTDPVADALRQAGARRRFRTATPGTATPAINDWIRGIPAPAAAPAIIGLTIDGQPARFSVDADGNATPVDAALAPMPDYGGGPRGVAVGTPSPITGNVLVREGARLAGLKGRAVDLDDVADDIDPATRRARYL